MASRVVSLHLCGVHSGVAIRGVIAAEPSAPRAPPGDFVSARVCLAHIQWAGVGIVVSLDRLGDLVSTARVGVWIRSGAVLVPVEAHPSDFASSNARRGSPMADVARLSLRHGVGRGGVVVGRGLAWLS